MGLWKWVKGRVVGEVLQDYGEVLHSSGWGQTIRLRLQLAYDDGRFFLIPRTTTSAFLSREIVYSRFEVTEADLERWRETIADVSSRIRAKRAELAAR